MLKFFLNMTKSEILIYKMIEQSSDFDYSISEIEHELSISRQTVCKSLKTLVTQKLVEKSDFFIGRIRRCKYKLNENLTSLKDAKNNMNENLTSLKDAKNNMNKNLTSLDIAKCNTETLENTSSDVVLGKKNTSSKTNQRTSKTIIFRPPDLIDNNINKDNTKSNQSNNTRFDLTCQVQNSKKFDKILEKIPEGTAKCEIYNLFKIFSKKKNDGDKLVMDFLDTESEKDSQDLFLAVVNSFGRRFMDKSKDIIRNIGGYLRKSIINAVQAFIDNKALMSECEQLVSDTEGAFKMAKLARNSILNAKNITYNHFEHRDYSDEDFESFYHNPCLQ